MSQWWQTVDNTVYDLIGPRFEPEISRFRDERVSAWPPGLFLTLLFSIWQACFCGTDMYCQSVAVFWVHEYSKGMLIFKFGWSSPPASSRRTLRENRSAGVSFWSWYDKNVWLNIKKKTRQRTFYSLWPSPCDTHVQSTAIFRFGTMRSFRVNGARINRKLHGLFDKKTVLYYALGSRFFFRYTNPIRKCSEK